jgi:CheY-like chemotaxis protein
VSTTRTLSHFFIYCHADDRTYLSRGRRSLHCLPRRCGYAEPLRPPRLHHERWGTYGRIWTCRLRLRPPPDWICHQCSAVLADRNAVDPLPTDPQRAAGSDLAKYRRRQTLRLTLGRLSRPGSCDPPPTKPPVSPSLPTRHLHGPRGRLCAPRRMEAAAGQCPEARRALASRAPGIGRQDRVLDMGMPVVDGWEACRRLHAAATSKTPIIAVTGHALMQAEVAARAAGWDVYLTKLLLPESSSKKSGAYCRASKQGVEGERRTPWP